MPWFKQGPVAGSPGGVGSERNGTVRLARSAVAVVLRSNTLGSRSGLQTESYRSTDRRRRPRLLFGVPLHIEGSLCRNDGWDSTSDDTGPPRHDTFPWSLPVLGPPLTVIHQHLQISVRKGGHAPWLGKARKHTVT